MPAGRPPTQTRKVHEYVLEHIFEHRANPTVDQIIAGTGVPKSTVYYALRRLDSQDTDDVMQRALRLGAVMRIDEETLETVGHDEEGRVVWRKRVRMVPVSQSVGNMDQINLTLEPEEVEDE